MRKYLISIRKQNYDLMLSYRQNGGKGFTMTNSNEFVSLAPFGARRVMNIMADPDRYAQSDLHYEVTIMVTTTTILGEVFEDEIRDSIHFVGYAKMSAEMQGAQMHNYVNSVKSEIVKCIASNKYMPENPPFGGYQAICLDF